jgi:hypothetical protein
VIGRTSKQLLAHRVLDLVVARLADVNGTVVGFLAGESR